MDGVLADFGKAIKKLDLKTKIKYINKYAEIDGMFKDLEPVAWAIDSVNKLSKYFDIYILSTAPWSNTPARTHKIERIHKYFWEDEKSILYKKVILSHHKNLNRWDYLIDDRDANGAKEFEWDIIKFWSKNFPNWESVLKYIFTKENIKEE